MKQQVIHIKGGISAYQCHENNMISCAYRMQLIMHASDAYHMVAILTYADCIFLP